MYRCLSLLAIFMIMFVVFGVICVVFGTVLTFFIFCYPIDAGSCCICLLVRLHTTCITNAEKLVIFADAKHFVWMFRDLVMRWPHKYKLMQILSPAKIYTNFGDSML